MSTTLTIGQTNNTTTDRPRFARVDAVTQAYGFSRGYLYKLLNAGTVKSLCVRDRGNVRGIRFVSVESLEEFIANTGEPGFSEDAKAAGRKARASRKPHHATA